MKGSIEKLWAVRPDVLSVMSALAAGDVSVEEVQAEYQTAARPPRVTGGVAVISLRGLITPRPSFLSLLFGGGGGLQGFRQSLREALNDDDVAAILLDIDSPGGVASLVAEAAAEVREARGTKPITALANVTAASAAYWIASQADELVVTPSGEVGSIGVFMAHHDWSAFDEKFGVKTTLISAGKYKTEGNPYEPLSDEAREAFQETVDDIYAQFVGDVAQGRNTTPAAVQSGYGEGRMLTAQRAVGAKMADRVETFEQTVGRLVGRPVRSREQAAAANPAHQAREHLETFTGNPEPNSTPTDGADEEAQARTHRARELMFPALDPA